MWELNENDGTAIGSGRFIFVEIDSRLVGILRKTSLRRLL
jgi:hypothetical protein